MRGIQRNGSGSNQRLSDQPYIFLYYKFTLSSLVYFYPKIKVFNLRAYN